MGARGTQKETFWRPEDIELLLHKRDVEKLDWNRIAQDFAPRTKRQCQARYHSQHALLRRKSNPVLPASVFERERADTDRQQPLPRSMLFAERTSITAEILGDPRPGQSALDKKRAGIVEREYFEPHSAALRPKPTLARGGGYSA